jgi:inhibitor of cysteine peptidase
MKRGLKMKLKKRKIVISTLLIASAFAVVFANLTNLDYCKGVLTKFESYSELKTFLQSQSYSYGHDTYSTLKSLSPSSSTFGSEYSTTDVQVEGVDEADTVKTDGEYLYVISGNRVVIVRAYPAEEAAVLSRIVFNGTLKQLFIAANRLVIFYETGDWHECNTTVANYDISDRENPKLLEAIMSDGHYFDSRMIGDYVYAIVTKYAGIVNDSVTLPEIYFENECTVASADEIHYSEIPSWYHLFITTLAINVQDCSQKPSYQTILAGYGVQMYVSTQNMYLATEHNDKTFLHRIELHDGEISYAANGEVQGTLLNQFSMDEHEDFLRIATTSQLDDNPIYLDSILKLENNLFVLDMNLKIVGSIGNIAPGEQIHSVRFMGDTGYVVTFRKTDPFFVVDLSNPYNPTMLGELKITGYSDYLHVYDKNHVIGVGKETAAAEEGDFSWYQGVKISLFDVTKACEPIEIAKYEIGDRGTQSPVLDDHKAFLFDKERKLLVIPVSVAEINQSQGNKIRADTYGQLVWQGAYVFTISLDSENLIELKGRITHVENGNLSDTSNYVTRALYINEILYTVSQNKIKMNLLSDLSEVAELKLN